MKVQTAAEQLLFSTLRIETGSSVGTGFIVDHTWAEGRHGPFLVTNKHVVQGSQRGRMQFHSRHPSNPDGPGLGKTTSIEIDGQRWAWVGHPSADIDVAVMALAPLLDALTTNGKAVFFRSIPTTLIPNQQALEELDAVEEVLFIGYPNNVYDRTNNLPIARKGTTATPPSINYEGKPLFLIDASVFPGSSGSPVFVYNVGGWTGRHGMTLGQRVLFLGILAAVLYRREEGTVEFEEIPTALRPVIATREMIDLGLVFKAHTVVETIEALLRRFGELPGSAPVVGENS